VRAESPNWNRQLPQGGIAKMVGFLAARLPQKTVLRWSLPDRLLAVLTCFVRGDRMDFPRAHV
jgi:hypothetical protein